MIKDYFNQMTFRQAVWLFPVAFSLHVAEETAFGFTAWAQKFASAEFTFGEYLRIHSAGIVGAFFAAFILHRFSNRVLVLPFFAFMFAPACFWNAFFHAGASLLSGEYCPGLTSALVIYLPLFYFVSRKALKENLLSARTACGALIFAGIFHTLEVGYNVFKVW